MGFGWTYARPFERRRPNRASGTLNQRPKRCSWPTAAATNLPDVAIAMPLMNPGTGTVNSAERLRPASSHSQKRKWPSHEPEMHTSENAGDASAVNQHGPAVD